MNWRWIFIAALLGALAIGYGAWNRRDATPGFLSAVPERPKYYLRNAVITETQEDGSVVSQLAAARIEMQPATEDLSMQNVNLHYHQSSQQEWRMTAERGFRAGNSPVIELAGNVLLRPADGDARDALSAEELAIDTQREIAYSTSSPVRIRHGNHAILVDSFRFDMKDEKLHMKSVQGQYEQG
jgi:LPS export ABC transporter protein LptC